MRSKIEVKKSILIFFYFYFILFLPIQGITFSRQTLHCSVAADQCSISSAGCIYCRQKSFIGEPDSSPRALSAHCPGTQRDGYPDRQPLCTHCRLSGNTGRHYETEYLHPLSGPGFIKKAAYSYSYFFPGQCKIPADTKLQNITSRLVAATIRLLC